MGQHGNTPCSFSLPHLLFRMCYCPAVVPHYQWKLAEGSMKGCHEKRRVQAAQKHIKKYLLLRNFTKTDCDSSVSRQRTNFECCYIYFYDTKISLRIYETLSLDLLIPSGSVDYRLVILSQLTSVTFIDRQTQA